MAEPRRTAQARPRLVGRVLAPIQRAVLSAMLAVAVAFIDHRLSKAFDGRRR